ncbi:MAG: TIGR01212 family radical SAM protein [bacterium]
MADIAGEKRYRAFSEYLKEKYGCKVYKVSLDAGFTCPNRDGRLGTGGCIYCNNQGFSPNTREPRVSISEQLEKGAAYMRSRYKAEKFISYFQAYTNTYAPVETLEPLYREALAHKDVVGLSVGTRPDCIEDPVIDLLADIGRDREVWIELGLQSAHDSTLEAINRQHDVATFVDTVRRIKKRPNLKICAHIILGLPGESQDMMLDSADLLSELGVHGIKIHLLHILKDTPLEEAHRRGEVKIFDFNAYVGIVCDYLERLDSSIIIQRLTADGPADLLIAPLWALEKKRTIDRIEKELLKKDTRQGSKRRPAAQIV